jgi:hypothetical protein
VLAPERCPISARPPLVGCGSRFPAHRRWASSLRRRPRTLPRTISSLRRRSLCRRLFRLLLPRPLIEGHGSGVLNEFSVQGSARVRVSGSAQVELSPFTAAATAKVLVSALGDLALSPFEVSALVRAFTPMPVPPDRIYDVLRGGRSGLSDGSHRVGIVGGNQRVARVAGGSRVGSVGKVRRVG